MHKFKQIREELLKIAKEVALSKNISLEESVLGPIVIEPPKDKAHGCMASNVAMVLSKPFFMKPQDLANLIKPQIEKLNSVKKVEIAGPGFINISLADEFWISELKEIVASGNSYGNSNIGLGKKVNIEYVSANPTGPMHVGHTRGAAYGDSLALLMMKCGFEVTKEYIINDAGSQITTLAKSVFIRYRQALGETNLSIPEGLYPGDYLVPVGEALSHKYGRDLLAMEEKEWLKIVSKEAVESMMALIKKDLSDFGVHHDLFVSEAELTSRGLIEKAVEVLDKQGLMYKGILEVPKGKTADDWEEREQVLFKSTEFGDDLDRALQKSNGAWTYFAADCGYALDKISRGFDNFIIILGADHSGYVKRMKAIISALSFGKSEIDVKICQLVNFMKDGQPFKMSKRAGTFVTLSDVVEAVGKDVVRFIMLTRKNDMVLDFDMDKVLEQSKDNPIFYVQYAHARCKSIIRESVKQGVVSHDELTKAELFNFSVLTHPYELDMIKKLAEFPRIIEMAAEHHEPHRVAFYLIELASEFHAFWNKGKEDASLRFIIEGNKELTTARIGLIIAIADVIASGLFIFNVDPMHSM